MLSKDNNSTTLTRENHKNDVGSDYNIENNKLIPQSKRCNSSGKVIGKNELKFIDKMIEDLLKVFLC